MLTRVFYPGVGLDDLLIVGGWPLQKPAVLPEHLLGGVIGQCRKDIIEVDTGAVRGGWVDEDDHNRGLVHRLCFAGQLRFAGDLFGHVTANKAMMAGDDIRDGCIR